MPASFRDDIPAGQSDGEYLARLIGTLRDIGGYPLPVYIIEGHGEMVPLENAEALRTMAKDALAAIQK